MAVNWRVVWRKAHRRAALLAALPLLVVILTGLLLQLKKDWAWVQPPTARGPATRPEIGFDAVLAAAAAAPEAGVTGWPDVDRVDVQPGRGVAKVQAKSGWEVQVDLRTGSVLRAAYRRSDVIEAIHDGSWFHPLVKLWVFLPAALLLLGLWLTGLYLYVLPVGVRRRQRRRHDTGG